MTDVPVIIVTSHDDAVTELAGFELGAADFIAKPVDAPLLLARVHAQLRVKRMTDELRRIATVDGLTGLANRRKFDVALEIEWLRGRRCGDPVTLLLIDVDHFKAYNDFYGHPRGDLCLQEVSRALLHASLRPADVVARFGGEEFAILLPQTSRAGGEHMARRVLGTVAALAIPHETSPTANHVTVSVGVACYDISALDVNPASARDSADGGARRSSHALLQTADRALYSAKRAGRAQARLLDFADTDAVQLARDITA
jgi:diguanylate cyclase (GGDEF)-like protein